MIGESLKTVLNERYAISEDKVTLKENPKIGLETITLGSETSDLSSNDGTDYENG